MKPTCMPRPSLGTPKERTDTLLIRTTDDLIRAASSLPPIFDEKEEAL